LEGYDRWLARYRKGNADAWCSNAECQYHDGTTVTVEEEYGQRWATPEECPLCNSDWLYEPPKEGQCDE
jgi:hypothetical protein